MKSGKNKMFGTNHKQFSILIFSIVLFFTINPNESAAQLKKVAQSGMQYLKIGVGAKMAGRGEAGIASITDIDAIFWNPAGLALMPDRQFLFTHNRWIADISHNALAFAMNLENIGTFGISFIYMDYGKFYPTVRDPNDFGLQVDDGFLDPDGAATAGIYLDPNLNPVDLAVGIAYAKQFTEKFWMGIHVKIVHEDLGTNLIQRVDAVGNPIGNEEVVENKLTNLAVDFGTVYQPGFSGLSFSVVFQNFGPEMTYEVEEFPLPFAFRMGLSMDMNEALDWADPLHALDISFDTIMPNDYSQRFHLGTQYAFRNLLFFRAGYKFNYDIESFTAGVGVLQIIGGVNWKIDVSYTQTERFTSPLRFSIAGQF